MQDWRLAAAAVWLGLCGLAGAAPPAPEIAARHAVIRNGGFEEGDELPVFWDRHPREPQNRNAHQRDTTVSHSGQASGKLVWLDPIAGPNQAWLQWLKYGLPVEGGSSLLVSGFVRTEAGVPGSRVGIHLYDHAGAHLGFHLVAEFGPTPDWQGFESELPLPPEAAKMGIALYSRQGGATWYDDIAVIGTPATKASQATPTVDGRLDEPCYAPDLAIADFVVHTGDKLPTETTRASKSCATVSRTTNTSPCSSAASKPPARARTSPANSSNRPKPCSRCPRPSPAPCGTTPSRTTLSKPAANSSAISLSGWCSASAANPRYAYCLPLASIPANNLYGRIREPRIN